MGLDVISSEIISECVKEHGSGELFFRRDGLEFESRRVEARQAYLAAQTELDEGHRLAISQAAITPGMTKPQVTAAWGLLEEDTRLGIWSCDR